jgi:hypothetical protein
MRPAKISMKTFSDLALSLLLVLMTGCAGDAVATSDDAAVISLDATARDDARTPADGDPQNDYTEIAGDARSAGDARAAHLDQLVGDVSTQLPPNAFVTDFLSSITRRYLDSFKSGRTPVIWSESEQLEAMIVLYEATSDARLLDEIAAHADVLVAHTSRKRNLRDDVRGSTTAAWPTDSYTCKKTFTHAVHTGVLSWPLAWFAKTVASDARLGARFGNRARQVVSAVASALALHEAQYKSEKTGASYRYPSAIGSLGSCGGTDYAALAGAYLPFNMMLAMGRAHLHLSQAMLALDPQHPDAAYHRERAAALFAFFRSKLTYHSASASYGWDYKLGGRPEDIAHGAWVVRAVLDAYAARATFLQKAVFSQTDMTRFSNSYRSLTATPSLVRSHIDFTGYGNGRYDARWQQAATRLIGLAAIDQSAYDVGRNIYYNHAGKTLLGRALLYRYRADDRDYPITATCYGALPCYRPLASLQATSGRSGLYRPASASIQTVAGKAVSSCISYRFSASSHQALELRYRQATEPIAGDHCEGGYCNSSPGLLAFISQDGKAWKATASLPLPKTGDQVNTLAPASAYRYVLLCRSGAGSARDNLWISYLRR